jgi:tripartite ATP-independent transporter DctP family solute receptor
MVIGFAGLVSGAMAAPHVARAATRVIRFGHNNTDESHYARGSAAFAAAVAADPALSAAVRVEVHGNAELGDELSMLKGCAASTLDGMLCSNAVMGNLISDFGLLNAPFLFRDVQLARATLDGEIGDEFAKRAAAKAVHVMAWSENGLRHITSNQPIRSPADLHGLKIRVPQSSVMLGGFKALGADAAPLNFSLLREALRTGQFQAQENPIVVIEAAKLYELQKFLSLTGHVYDPAAFICSDDVMDDLTEAQRTALTACAKKGAAVTREASASAQKDGVARLTAKGMTVVDNVDIPAFRAAGRPYLESLSTSFDTILVKRLLDAAA